MAWLAMEYQPDLFRLLDLPPLKVARANHHGALRQEDCHWHRVHAESMAELIIGLGKTAAGYHSGFGCSYRGALVGGPVFTHDAYPSATAAYAAAAHGLLKRLAVSHDKGSDKHRKALLAFAIRTL